MAKINYAPYVFINKNQNNQNKIEVFVISPVDNGLFVVPSSKNHRIVDDNKIYYSFETGSSGSSVKGFYTYNDPNPITDTKNEITEVIVQITAPDKVRITRAEEDDWDKSDIDLSSTIAFQYPHICLNKPKGGNLHYPQLLLPLRGHKLKLENTEFKNEGEFKTSIQIESSSNYFEIEENFITNSSVYGDVIPLLGWFEAIVAGVKIKIKNKNSNPMPPPTTGMDCKEIISNIRLLLNTLEEDCICSDNANMTSLIINKSTSKPIVRKSKHTPAKQRKI